MKIKRLICVLLVVLMVVGLAACGGHVNTETAENANTITPAQSPYTWSTTPKAYVYDTVNGVWKPWYQELSQTLLNDDPVHDAANPFLHSR